MTWWGQGHNFAKSKEMKHISISISILKYALRVCVYPCTLKRSFKNVPIGPCKPSCTSAWIPAEREPHGRCRAGLAAEEAPEQGGVASKAPAASCLSVSCQQLPLATSRRNWREEGDVPGRAQCWAPTEDHGTAHICTLHLSSVIVLH